jgi:hypothetical protein
VAGEELAAIRTWEAKDVLEIRGRGRDRSRPGGIEQPARSGEQKNRCDARADLEFAIGNVLVRHPLAREVEEQPEGNQTIPPACWLRNAGWGPRSSRAEDLEAHQRAANALVFRMPLRLASSHTERFDGIEILVDLDDQ